MLKFNAIKYQSILNENEIAINNIQVKNNIYCLKNDMRGYTGNVYERFGNGEYKTKGEIKNGLENGVWRRWYKNGQLYLEGHFKKGLKHGKFTIWYENDQKKREEYFKNELEHGELKIWDKDGNILFVGSWLNGEPIGNHIDYNSDGSIADITKY